VPPKKWNVITAVTTVMHIVGLCLDNLGADSGDGRFPTQPILDLLQVGYLYEIPTVSMPEPAVAVA
jgi:hypothetical protein